MQTPNGYQELINEFGDPAKYITEDGRVMPQWEYEQMGFADLPMPVRLSWDKSRLISKIYCHRKMKPIFEDVFCKIDTAGLWEHVLEFGGCFNWRAKRGQNKLSTHCWGIAIDINPEQNAMGTYGNMNQDVIEIFEDAGFIWGGRWKPVRQCDPQHFQFCRNY